MERTEESMRDAEVPGLIDYENILYPQYWDECRTPIFMDALSENPKHWAKEAHKLLAEDRGVENVRCHWRWIIETCAPLEPAGEKNP